MELKNLLDEISLQNELLKELFQILERETAEMGNVNIAAMTVSNQAKEKLIADIAERASYMPRIISELAVREGLSQSASLGTLAEQMAKRGNRELIEKQQQISSSAAKVQQAAALNREIAERFASSVTTSLNLLMRLINQSNVYGASGGYQQRPAGAVMINREA